MSYSVRHLLAIAIAALTLFPTSSNGAAGNFCRKIEAGAIKHPFLVKVSGDNALPVGKVVELGEVYPTESGMDEFKFYLIVSANQQADASLPNREYSIIPSDSPIKCGRRWAYGIEFNFSDSVIEPGKFDRDIAIFSRNSDGSPGEAANSTAMTGNMRRPRISVKADSYAPYSIARLSILNTGNMPTAPISVFFDVNGTWVLHTEKCDGKVLLQGDQCQVEIQERERKHPRQLLVVSDGRHKPWQFAIDYSSNGRDLSILP